MRISYLKLVALLTLPAGIWFSACSDSVTTNNSASSSSSSGSSSSSSGNTGGGGAGGTANMGGMGGTANMGGMGGGSSAGICKDACDHATACGIPVCSLIGINCNSATDYTCPSQCLLDASCAQIGTIPAFPNIDPTLQACLNACQSGDAGTGDCTTCGFMNCQAEGGACNADTAPMGCQSWFMCIQACSDAACVADCDTKNPGAKPESDNLRTCLCGQCGTECASLGACGMGGAGGAGGQGGN